MRRRTINLASGIARVPRVGTVLGHVVNTVTQNGIDGMLTMAAAHANPGTASIVITGTGAYDGTFTGGGAGYSINSPTTFIEAPGSGSFAGNSFGGLWRF